MTGAARILRRQRIGALALVVVVAIAGGIAVAKQSPSRRRRAPAITLHRVAGFTQLVVLARAGDFVRADFHLLRVETARPPAGTFTHYPTALIRRRGGFAFVTDGHAFASSLHLEGPLTQLGVAVDAFPAVRADRVWLVDLTRTMAREVDVRGRGFGDAIALPADRVPVAEVEGGWLVKAGDGIEIVGRAGGGRRIAEQARLLDTTPTRVMWQAANGAIQVLHLPEGTVAPVAAMPAQGAGAEIVAGSLAPTGDATVVVTRTGEHTLAFVSASQQNAVATVVDLELTGRPPTLAWSSDGSFVLVGSVGSGFIAVDARTGRSGPTGLPFTPAIAIG